MFRRKTPDYRSFSYINPVYSIAEGQAVIGIYGLNASRIIIMDFVKDDVRNVLQYSIEFKNEQTHARNARWKKIKLGEGDDPVKWMLEIRKNYTTMNEIQLDSESFHKFYEFFSEIMRDNYNAFEHDLSVSEVFDSVDVKNVFAKQSRCSIL